MQNDDLPDMLGPLMMRVKGCLNRIYSHMTDLAVLQTPNISEGDGRVVTEALTLKERESIKLYFGLCHCMYHTVRPLTFNLALSMYCYGVPIFPS